MMRLVARLAVLMPPNGLESARRDFVSKASGQLPPEYGEIIRKGLCKGDVVMDSKGAYWLVSTYVRGGIVSLLGLEGQGYVTVPSRKGGYRYVSRAPETRRAASRRRIWAEKREAKSKEQR